MQGSPEPFELHALRYAAHDGRRASDNFIGGDPHESGSNLDYFVWVARRSDRLFVIDTGFGERTAALRSRRLLQRPAHLLAEFGIDPARVEDVILTHLHFDHAGTLDDFPAARFHVQDSELAFATGRCMCHAHASRPFDVEDVVGLVRKVYAGRVCFHHRHQPLCDGLSLHWVGGHSDGLQVVRVFTARGWVVLASDAAHLYQNFRQSLPFPIVHNVGDMLEGYRILHELADSPDHIIPGHDPMVTTLYPASQPGFEGRVLRLDSQPRSA